MGATVSERTPVHVCDLCHAIWEGPNPPRVCPNCRSQPTWQGADVGKQPGVVGGRLFVKGTDTPMVRVFYCKACTKMAVTRDGSMAPDVCPKCEGSLGWSEATPKKQIAIDATPVAVAQQLDQDNAKLDASIADLAKGEIVKVPSLNAMRADATQSAEEYRSEWIAERVAETRAGDFPDTTSCWAWFEALYDEGRTRRHLP